MHYLAFYARTSVKIFYVYANFTIANYIDITGRSEKEISKCFATLEVAATAMEWKIN